MSELQVGDKVKMVAGTIYYSALTNCDYRNGEGIIEEVDMGDYGFRVDWTSKGSDYSQSGQLFRKDELELAQGLIHPTLPTNNKL